MAFKSISGSRIIGNGTPQAVPIQLDPAPYAGAIAYGSDGRVYVSNGTAWADVGSGTTGAQGTQGVQGNQGVQGTYGPGFDVIGSVADVETGGDEQATLNAAFPSATTGQGAIDQADDELWVYDGATWVNVGSFRGIQGFTGSQGAQGTQGVIGEEGIQGSRGFRGLQGIQGIQGTTGIQGTQGIQGLQGTQGVQGNQGTTGIQGDTGIQGIQGDQGVQGIQGTTGIQGFTGIQGDTGDFGGVTYNYTYSATTADADPGQGIIRFNNVALNTATEMYIDDLDDAAVLIDGVFTDLASTTSSPKGYFKVINGADVTKFATFSYTAVVDNTGYWTFTVAHIQGETAFTDTTDLRITFMKTGDRGFQGIQGTTGIQGDTGIQGLLGNQGTQGPQSTQGVQGDTGIQGMQGTQGTQGVQGVQGVQGTTGIQGSQGTQGHQGVQGVQGVQGLQGDGGTQGIQGFQGFQGATGLQGDTGFQGLQGSMGYNGGLTFDFEFNNSTTEGFPGLNSWLLNNADVTAATRLYIDDLTDTGRRVDGLFNYLDSKTSDPKGTLFIRTPKDANGDYEFLIYSYSDWTWGGGAEDWGHFDVTFIDRSPLGGTDLSPGNSWDTGAVATYGSTAVFDFEPTGQKGTQGIQGTTGIQGDFGPQGIQGDQGLQGFQGTTGVQGAQGIAGAYGGASFEYDFTPDTGPSGPATGLLKFNNADITAATIMRIADTETNGNNIDDYLRSLDDGGSSVLGYIKVVSIFNPAEFVLYALTGLVENASYYNFTISYLTKSANADATYFTNNTDVIFTFTRAGDIGTQGIQGDQGVQGFQGDLGFQGATGAGAQGTTGIQGDLGPQGVQGFPGPIGPQGIQGTDGLQGGGGLQGSTGGFGGVTFDYTYSTNVAASDPGVGTLKFNNATLSSATTLFIDDRDDAFVDIQPFLRTVDDSTSPIKGHFKVSEKTTPANFVIFTISSLTEEAGYFSIDSAYVSGSVSNFTDAEDIIITFARTGDVGPLGPQGVQGFTGIQGGPGLQGNDGGVGLQGFQGLQGAQGFQGTAGFIGGDGTQGSQGTQGTQSVQGIAGQDGDEGAQGSQGLQGLTGSGAQGIQGTDGSQGIAGLGATGIQGFQGLQGIQQAGHQGIQGTDGPAGFGLQGTQGHQGAQGTDGDIGSQGVQGLGGQGTSGLQGVQGIDGDNGSQGLQGIDGDGNQGTQGFQGAIGVGGDGAQGTDGLQGIQGTDGESGVGGTQGVQGFDGIQGFQGIDGGLGDTGTQGVQGIPGDLGVQGAEGFGLQGLQGSQGVQGEIGIQGFPGQGTQGLQGTQAAQGVQGERGFQGIQGMQGFGPEGGVGNIQNVHETGLQGTPLFLAMFEGGATHRPMIGTSGPNPGGETNFFYTSDADELTVENIQVEGNITVVGTLTAANIEGATSDMHLATDIDITFGGDSATPNAKFGYENASQNQVLAINSTIVNSTVFRDTVSATDQFTFNMGAGNFTATGDVESNSDERLKENVETITNALDKVSNMRGVYFDMKSRPGVRKTGLIAQEVEKVLPEVVSTAEDGDNIKSVAYANVVGVLVEAIKELKEEVDNLKG